MWESKEPAEFSYLELLPSNPRPTVELADVDNLSLQQSRNRLGLYKGHLPPSHAVNLRCFLNNALQARESLQGTSQVLEVKIFLIVHLITSRRTRQGTLKN